jgi:hypothetical protein
LNIFYCQTYKIGFRRDIRTLLFGDSRKDQAQNILLPKAVQTFIVCYRLIFLYHKCLYTYYPGPYGLGAPEQLPSVSMR